MNTDAAPTTITFELSVDEVNLVLEALGKLPFVSVYQVIGRIQQQAQQQMRAASGDGTGSQGT